jgi:polysaccharide biosynthesis transport protein
MAMTTDDQDQERSSIDGGEVMFLLMKHRWKLILCTLAGIAAAAAVYVLHDPPYESQAKLLVRYVLERSPIDTMENQTGGSTQRNSDTLISSEREILQSWDLAFEVAEAVGPEQLTGLPPSPETSRYAAGVVRNGVVATSGKGSNVISVAFRHHNPELTVQVLNELLTRYFDKHLAVHRSVGAFEFVNDQKEQVGRRLAETEAKLSELKSAAEVISLAETTTLINQTLSRTQHDLELTEVALAEQQARVSTIEEMTGLSSRRPEPDANRASANEIQQYQAVVARLGVLRNEGLDLRSRYTPESRLVRMNRDQIAQLETQRRELEQRFPDLASLSGPSESSGLTRADLMSERARLAALTARTEALRGQLDAIKQRATDLSQYGPAIAQLERRKELEEQNFRYFEATLERARVDEALDPSKIPNISIVQRPSPPTTVAAEIHQQLAMLAGGGVLLGLGLVFIFGFLFDRSIKRPLELQRKLGLNHLLAIPHAQKDDLKALRVEARAALPEGTSPKDSAALNRAQMELFVQPYCDAVCDRLIHYFALAGKTHKPKLVAVTSCHHEAGTSTIAAGLAAALSRTGDGKVLLVDMNAHRSDHRYYFGGSHVSSLVEMLEPGAAQEPAAENLYLATVAHRGPEASRPLPTRFHHLLPRLKHSEFDYIVFDMPPATDTSPTLGMASFVDKVFLVVEAEKTSREAVKRAHDELLSMRADTSLLVNKTRQYGPARLRLDS